MHIDLMWLAWASTFAMAVGTWRHQRRHCGALHDLEDLIVTLDDLGVVLPDHLREVADEVRGRDEAYDHNRED